MSHNFLNGGCFIWVPQIFYLWKIEKRQYFHLCIICSLSSLWSSDTMQCHTCWSLLVQFIPWRLVGVKALPEPMDICGPFFSEILIKIQIVLGQKRTWKYRVQNIAHFVQTLVSLCTSSLWANKASPIRFPLASHNKPWIIKTIK